MKVIIAGSRTIDDYDYFLRFIERCPFKNEIDIVISGTANGVDKMGERWAEENKKNIVRFHPDWEKYGKAAGPIRNKQMALNADAAIILMVKDSKGAKNMYETAEKMGLKIFREFYL